MESERKTKKKRVKLSAVEICICLIAKKVSSNFLHHKKLKSKSSIQFLLQLFRECCVRINFFYFLLSPPRCCIVLYFGSLLLVAFCVYKFCVLSAESYAAFSVNILLFLACVTNCLHFIIASPFLPKSHLICFMTLRILIASTLLL